MAGRLTVPEGKLYVVTEHDRFNDSVEKIVTTNRNNTKRRDWFVNHAYHCLPLTIGNQYGFSINAIAGVRAKWNGGDAPSDVEVEYTEENQAQFISSHFGMGLLTLQNRFTFRTPDGVNLMTMDPTNTCNPYFRNLNGVIETDNLRRDFTFNIRIQRPNEWVEIKPGDVVASILPIPRYFPDSFELELAENIEEERQAMRDFGIERQTTDREKPNGNGKRYWKGEDVYGEKFEDHQRRMTGGPSKCPYHKFIKFFKDE